jgi:hypothetical protein
MSHPSLPIAGSPGARSSSWRRLRRVVVVVGAVTGLLAGGTRPLSAQTGTRAMPMPYAAPLPGAPAMPFAIGERLEYDVKFSWKSVGRGTMEVVGIDDIRGRPSWHTVFTIKGGIPFFRVDDRMESWFDVQTFSSRRFHQNIAEGGYKRSRRYEFFPERSVFTENDGAEEPSVPDPLDDASFLYFVRTIPLEVGTTVEVPRYFNPKGNPVRIRVVRKDTIKVPAGEFPTIVVQPTFQTRGIFSENGRAEVWLSDDAHRFMVQMKSSLKIGSINLYLKRYALPPAK